MNSVFHSFSPSFPFLAALLAGTVYSIRQACNTSSLAFEQPQLTASLGTTSGRLTARFSRRAGAGKRLRHKTP